MKKTQHLIVWVMIVVLAVSLCSCGKKEESAGEAAAASSATAAAAEASSEPEASTEPAAETAAASEQESASESTAEPEQESASESTAEPEQESASESTAESEPESAPESEAATAPALGAVPDTSAADAAKEMHKVIIDSDTGSDDAAALMIAALSDNIEILGVTVLYGNVSLDQAAKNALQVLELCGSDAPVYLGAEKPLEKERPEMVSVHGEDGMGDHDLIHPEREAESQDAVDFILETVRENPGEVEIVTIGPVTNIAHAILKDPETMKMVKHVWSMGTAGLGTGNASPVAEFNVYNDAESFKILVESALPITIAGWDLVVPENCFYEDDMTVMENGNEYGRFLRQATDKLYEFGMVKQGVPYIDVPDALTMAVLAWPECVDETRIACGSVCVGDDAAYGQVIMYLEGQFYEAMPSFTNYNLEIVSGFNSALFKEKFMEMLTG